MDSQPLYSIEAQYQSSKGRIFSFWSTCGDSYLSSLSGDAPQSYSSRLSETDLLTVISMDE